MEVQNRVSDIRRQKGLTQEQLAQATGVTRQTIIAIEKRHFTPSVKLALLLARALETPLENLFWLAEDDGGE